MRILLFVALLLGAGPALAQSSPNAFAYDYPKAELACGEALIFEQDFAAIRALPLVQEADPDRRKFCAFFSKAAEGPWRRYAVAQFGEDPYWCGSAGCQVVIFIEDQQGRWRPAMDESQTNNGFAKEEGGVTIDITRMRQGLPGIGIPAYDADNQITVRMWVFDPAAGHYTLEDESKD